MWHMLEWQTFETKCLAWQQSLMLSSRCDWQMFRILLGTPDTCARMRTQSTVPMLLVILPWEKNHISHIGRQMVEISRGVDRGKHQIHWMCVYDSAALLQCREHKGGGGTSVCQRALASMTNPAATEQGLTNYNVWWKCDAIRCSHIFTRHLGRLSTLSFILLAQINSN